MSLFNTNVFSREVIPKLIEVIKNRPVTIAEKDIIDNISKIKKENIIEYPCNLGMLQNLLPDKDKDIYTGLDFRNNFIKSGNDKTKLIDLSDNKPKPKADVLICNDYIHRVNNPIEFIKQLIEKFAPENVYISMPVYKSGQSLSDMPKFEIIANNRYISFRYSQESAEKIAQETGLQIKFVSEGDNTFAILFKANKAKEEIKKDNKELEQSKPEEENKEKQPIPEKEPKQELEPEKKSKKSKKKQSK